MIRTAIGLFGTGPGAEITNFRYNKYLNPIVNCTNDADALDNSQCFPADAWDTGTEWRMIYTGANTVSTVYQPDGLSYVNVDQGFLAIKTKSNEVKTGWNKLLDVNGDPKPVFQPSFVNLRFDKAQVWLRSILREGSGLKGWFVGDPGGVGDYTVGYATCANLLGEVWTKSGTTPVFSHGAISARGIVIFKVVYSPVLSKYVGFYCGITPNITGYFIAQSTDGITGWATTHSNLLSGQNLGFPGNITYDNGVYYVWLQKNFQTGSNLGPAREMYVYRSTDLTTWTSLGPQFKIRPSNEFGIGNDVRSFQKPNGNWFTIVGSGKGRVQALAGSTIEPSSFIKVAEIEHTSWIANSECANVYPQNVSFHAPLGHEMGLLDVISGNSGTSNTSGHFSEFQFRKLLGSETLTFPNSGVINGANFGVKLRVEIVTTGTHELFSIGADIVVSLVSGKLRVRLSSNGAGYEKDYITTVNISKPVGLDYIDNHIYVGFTWVGGVLTLYNDFVPFTVGQLTKTVDTALTTVNNSAANILIGQNATIELRSVSVLGGNNILMGDTDILWGDDTITFETAFGTQQFIDLDI